MASTEKERRTLRPMRIAPFLKGPLIGLATVLLLSALGEVVLRAQHSALRGSVPGRQLCTRPSDQPGLIYEMAAGRCGFNSLGFPDSEHDRVKEACVFRVLIVGDSVAAAQGIDREHGFPRLIERRLRNRLGRPVEVVTMAVSGYGTSEELAVLERLGLRFEPDVVIWSYVLNDPAHPVFHDANGLLGRYHHRPGSRLLSALASLSYRIAELARCREREFHRLLHCAHREEIRENLSRLEALTIARGTPVLFLLHPIFEVGVDPSETTLGDIHDELLILAQARGFDVLDLREAYRGRKAEALAQRTPEGTLDPWHPNAEGHRLAALSIVRRLKRYLATDPETLETAPALSRSPRSLEQTTTQPSR